MATAPTRFRHPVTLDVLMYGATVGYRDGDGEHEATIRSRVQTVPGGWLVPVTLPDGTERVLHSRRVLHVVLPEPYQPAAEGRTRRRPR